MSVESVVEQRRIIIAVTGSIAAYKACDLVRNLSKREIPVRVMMTENATRFIGPVTFQALSGRPVILNQWDEGMIHIDIKREAGIFAVIPATANIIGKFASGIADDIVSSAYLAMEVPRIIAPAMNPTMYASGSVQRNLRLLREDGIEIIEPGEGAVVCGDFGRGRIAPPEEIEKLLLDRYFQIVSPESIV